MPGKLNTVTIQPYLKNFDEGLTPGPSPGGEECPCTNLSQYLRIGALHIANCNPGININPETQTLDLNLLSPALLLILTTCYILLAS